MASEGLVMRWTETRVIPLPTYERGEVEVSEWEEFTSAKV